ncbi:MAG: hypothetical protein KJ882_05105 [Proteobacteria bacterium]|nr:hypothetical protein [Pseudomonadota bacterium]MBU4010124.1 hypothetical protein [Pseudomonadota bacterium]MBU4036930.1 hypothetical protein [Pseudomonadota bacterium]
MNNRNILLNNNPITSLHSAKQGFKPLYGIEVKNEICPLCGFKHTILPLEETIAVGFGNALLTKNSECIYSEIDARCCNDYLTVAQAEELADADPNQDWRIHLIAPFSELHYQRQGKRHWVLYEKREGFA